MLFPIVWILNLKFFQRGQKLLHGFRAFQAAALDLPDFANPTPNNPFPAAGCLGSPSRGPARGTFKDMLRD